MDITQLGEKLGDIKIGDIEGGIIVREVNSHLDPDKHVTGSTTGNELKELYTSLSTEQKNKLDTAIRFENDPKTMVNILQSIYHLETQRISIQEHMESSRTTYILLALLAVLVYNYWTVYGYHLQAMEVMGDTYKSNTITFVGEMVRTLEQLLTSSTDE